MSISDGTSLALVSGVDLAGGLALAGPSVYFPNGSQTFVVPKVGGNAVVLASEPTSITAVASDGTTICWTRADFAIRCVATAGGTPDTVRGASIPLRGLQVLAGNVFTMETDPTSPQVNTIIKIPVGGGAAAALATADSTAFFATEDWIVFWNQTAFWRVSTSGGEPASLGPFANRDTQLLADHACLFWAASDLEIMPINGSTEPATFAKIESTPWMLGRDEHAIYIYGPTGISDTGQPTSIERFAE